MEEVEVPTGRRSPSENSEDAQDRADILRLGQIGTDPQFKDERTEILARRI